MDPFDEALDRRIWSLADTRLQWHKRIAETRRTIPTEIETTLSAMLERHKELDQILLPVGSEDISEEEANTDEDGEREPQNSLFSLDILSVDRQQRIEESLQKTSALANELDQVSHTNCFTASVNPKSSTDNASTKRKGGTRQDHRR